jgi:hypothetical protein
MGQLRLVAHRKGFGHRREIGREGVAVGSITVVPESSVALGVRLDLGLGSRPVPGTRLFDTVDVALPGTAVAVASGDELCNGETGLRDPWDGKAALIDDREIHYRSAGDGDFVNRCLEARRAGRTVRTRGPGASRAPAAARESSDHEGHQDEHHEPVGGIGFHHVHQPAPGMVMCLRRAAVRDGQDKREGKARRAITLRNTRPEAGCKSGKN